MYMSRPGKKWSGQGFHIISPTNKRVNRQQGWQEETYERAAGICVPYRGMPWEPEGEEIVAAQRAVIDAAEVQGLGHTPRCSCSGAIRAASMCFCRRSAWGSPAPLILGDDRAAVRLPLRSAACRRKERHMELSAYTPLPVPVPPMLEAALGYTGSARLVAFYWEPAGDEARFDDGVVNDDGDWEAYIGFVNHPQVKSRLGAFDPGSSEGKARQWLVLDRQARALYALPVYEAAGLLHQQWATRAGHPVGLESPEDLQAVLAAFTDERGWQEVTVDLAVVEQRMREQGERLSEMLAWLDQQEAGQS